MSAPGCRIAVLISGTGSNLQALIDACAAGTIPGRIEQVLSNRDKAGGLARAQRAGIPTGIIRHTDYADREAYDRALARQLEQAAPDLVVLAGFMRILSDTFVDAFHGRLINIHPSLLPAHRGLHTHERALAAGDRQHGCSVHYVIPALDAGPVIAQGVLGIQPADTPATLAERVQRLEHRLYPLVVRWLAEGRVQMQGDRVCLDGEPLAQPPGIAPLEA